MVNKIRNYIGFKVLSEGHYNIFNLFSVPVRLCDGEHMYQYAILFIEKRYV